MGNTNCTCAMNWTSCCRGDDSVVPAVEKHKTDTFDTTMPQNIEDLQNFGESLETGDILLMHCTHTFGKIAQVLTGNIWDHVAVVVRLDPNDPDAVKARKALIEKAPRPISKTMSWPNPGEEGPVEVLEAMGGGTFAYPFTAHAICRGKFIKYAAVRRLRNAKGEPIGQEKRKQIEAFIKEFWARPYEEGRAGMFEIARPLFHRNPSTRKKRDKSKEMLDNLFCSETVVEAYQAARILPEETLNSNEVLPSMFAPSKVIDKYLKKEQHGYSLGPVEIYKAPETPLSDAIQDRRKELQSHLTAEGHEENTFFKPQ